jgi:uncharacterized protein (DUF362 family)
MPEPNSAQRAHKKQGRSKVSLLKVPSYDELEPAMSTAWAAVGPDVKGKSVFLKINLVDYRNELPVFTDPRFIHGAIKLLAKAGAAKIIVGDGPAMNRDTEQILKLTGIADVLKAESVEFVDLNIDDAEKVVNSMNFTGLPELLLPKSVLNADMLFSIPKLKTHHWALMTCSMKNMFGVIPGRKYGWPKNVLHVKGIQPSIVDIVAMAKPAFAMVDGVVAMEGDGPLHGSAINLSAMIMGADLVAVDTVAGMCMSLPVHVIPYLKTGGLVLGNSDLSQIDIVGDTVDSVKKKFVLPPTFEADGTVKDRNKLNSGAESGIT